ncbi:MAG: lysine--tRNA ligase, partial [Deltaproteobacteria bacterium]|nr:lysine--tRNA ligase [Deltaproteobacteria bacterium]
YPNDFRVSCPVADAVAQGTPLDGPALDASPIRLSLAGRVMAVNSFGKAAFVRIKDRSGLIQVYVRSDSVDASSFERLKLTDVGDQAGATGVLMRTRTGELTLKAEQYRVLSKGLRPLPEKWHGLRDAEMQQRMRYVDLIMSDESRERFRLRTRIVQHIRRFLDARGYLEVETPMLHSVLGGANARPFRTHHNTLDMELYLRIAPELFLKRLVVGGFERVYEINRNFRNEGISTRHNPEFTMIEFYQAYATYEDLMDLTEELLRGMVAELLGRTTVGFKGHEIDFGKPFVRLSVCDGLRTHCGYPEEAFTDAAKARALAVEHGVPPEEADKVVAKHAESARDAALELGMLVFEKEVEDHLVQPTFVIDFPAAVSPLSRRKDADPSLVDRFELYVANAEIANAFSELNDPVDQAGRFRAQLAARAAGDHEAMEYDEDYVRALEYGMPPTAGEGIGIDRLTMLLTGEENIRDVILFPLLRPEAK